MPCKGACPAALQLCQGEGQEVSDHWAVAGLCQHAMLASSPHRAGGPEALTVARHGWMLSPQPHKEALVATWLIRAHSRR